MAFFGQPSYSMGPFHYPAQPGTFDRILQIADVGTNLLGLYQKFKDRKLKDVVNKLAVGRELYGDQPMPVDETLGKQIEKVSGFQLPKVTEESRRQNLAEIISSGGATVPGMKLTDPALAEAKAPQVGTFAPLPGKAPKTLEELAVKALTKGKGAAGVDAQQAMNAYLKLKGKDTQIKHVPGVGLVNALTKEVVFPEPEKTTKFFDPTKGTTTTVPGANVKAITPWTDPKELAKFRSDLENEREVEVLDPITGLPMSTAKKGSKFAPQPKPDPTAVVSTTTSETQGPMGKEVKTSVTEKTRKGQAAQSQGQAVTVKGIGNINAQDLPSKIGYKREYQTGTIIRTGETKYRVIPKEGAPYEVELGTQ